MKRLRERARHEDKTAVTSGWLVTRVSSAPVMLVVNDMVLTLVALYFLIYRHGLKDM
jgi:hypothetical protein